MLHAARGGRRWGGLRRAFAVGIEAVIVSAVATWTDQVAHAADSGVRHAYAVGVQMFVTAAGALNFLFFGHECSLPAVHRQAVYIALKV